MAAAASCRTSPQPLLLHVLVTRTLSSHDRGARELKRAAVPAAQESRVKHRHSHRHHHHSRRHSRKHTPSSLQTSCSNPETGSHAKTEQVRSSAPGSSFPLPGLAPAAVVCSSDATCEASEAPTTSLSAQTLPDELAQVLVELPLVGTETVELLKQEIARRWNVSEEAVSVTDSTGQAVQADALLTTFLHDNDHEHPPLSVHIAEGGFSWHSPKHLSASSASLDDEEDDKELDDEPTASVSDPAPTSSSSSPSPSSAASSTSTSTSGLILQLSRCLFANTIEPLIDQLRALDHADLLVALPIFVAVNDDRINAILAELASSSCELQTALQSIVYQRPPFANLDALLPADHHLDSDPLFARLARGDTLQEGHDYEIEGAFHPMTFAPIDFIHVDHVFKRSLARPAIVSLFVRKQNHVDSTVHQDNDDDHDHDHDEVSVQSSASSVSQVVDNDVDAPPQLVAPRFLVKRGEDIYHERCIQLLFRLFNEVWTERLPESLRPRVFSFAEIPLGTSLGLLEIIEHCESLEHVELHNFDAVTDHEEFLHTSCGWILAAYLLGLSDRHRDNTLVSTVDSTAIPIDFGFMLGATAPGVNTYLITISSEMHSYLVRMGTWPRFCAMFLCGFYVLRHEAPFISSLATTLFRGFRDTEFLRRFFAVRFMLDEPIDYRALKRMKKHLRHAPVCVDTKIKLNSLALGKAVLSSFGKTALLRMIVGNASTRQTLTPKTHIHFSLVSWKLPDSYPAELPENLLFLLRQLQTSKGLVEADKLASFGDVPIQTADR